MIRRALYLGAVAVALATCPAAMVCAGSWFLAHMLERG